MKARGGLGTNFIAAPNSRGTFFSSETAPYEPSVQHSQTKAINTIGASNQSKQHRQAINANNQSQLSNQSKLNNSNSADPEAYLLGLHGKVLRLSPDPRSIKLAHTTLRCCSWGGERICDAPAGVDAVSRGCGVRPIGLRGRRGACAIARKRSFASAART